MKRKQIIIGTIIVVVIAFIFYFALQEKKEIIYNGVPIPDGPVHWHPMLTIIIDGQHIPIPDDIGYGTGKIMDTHLSGMRMSPTHTHESDGTIHIENLNPRAKPETLTLGYFFEIWDKTFNESCIFEYCTDEGTLTMYVNGQENTEYSQYVMRDGDQITIEYTSGGTK